MLSDKERMAIYTAGYEEFWASPSDPLPLGCIETRDRDAGLRAVEAAVRADQIEKDAGIAGGQRPWNYDRPDDWTDYARGAVMAADGAAAAIRAQLPAIVSAPNTPEQEGKR